MQNASNYGKFVGRIGTFHGNPGENVSLRAGTTAKHTNEVAESTVLLQSAFQDINTQIQDQKGIVAPIVESNSRSRRYY